MSSRVKSHSVMRRSPGGKVDQVGAGGGVIARGGVFPVWLAGADRFKEVAEMQDGGDPVHRL